MRLVTYDLGKAPRAGLASAGMVADLEKAALALTRAKLPASVRELLESEKATAAAYKVAERLEKVVTQVEDGKLKRPAWLLPDERVHLGPPIPDPEKVICVGLNYKCHCREQEGRFGRSVEPPPNPIIFTKFRTSLCGPYDPIQLPPVKVAAQIDYEVELAVVIGATMKNVSQKQAAQGIAGYMIMNDVSARDCQFADKQWTRAKSFDTFAPCGPALVTPDQVPTPRRLRLQTVLNGQVLQDSNTREMIFTVPRIIAYLSTAFTLKPGDILSTGTPAGVGIFRQPPVLMQPGDTVECSIEGLGSLCNTCERVK